MEYFEVGYERDGFFSINMIKGTFESAQLIAEKHAKKHGYKVAYLNKVDESYAESQIAKGMPLIVAEKYLS